MKKIQVVCAIIRREEGFLIARRGKGIHENIWEFPGGKVEENEAKEEAIIREIKEELSWDIKVVKHLCDVIDEREDCVLEVCAFLCRYKHGNLRLHAHHEARYVSFDELSQYTFEEADKGIIDSLGKEIL